MDTSIFSEKNFAPDQSGLKRALKRTFEYWIDIRDHIYSEYPDACEVWTYSGEKSGWNFRVMDKKRVITYFMPLEGYFRISMVLGKKAVEEALAAKVSDDLKSKIRNAIVYAEGTGIVLYVQNKRTVKDVKKLIEIKLSN